MTNNETRAGQPHQGNAERRKISIYLDTSIVSRIRDYGRLDDAAAQALEKLSEFSHQIHYVTSDTLTNEVARTKDPRTRGALLLFAAIIDKVPWEVPEHPGGWGGAPFGVMPWGAAGWTHPLYAGLSEIFDRLDAHHLFLAVRAECDYFLTLDRKTIIERATAEQTRVSELCGKTTIVDPQELCRTLEALRSLELQRALAAQAEK